MRSLGRAMSIIPVLTDSCPAYLAGRAESISLLTLPLGTGTFLSRLQSQLATLTAEPVTVLSCFDAQADYEHVIRRAANGPVRFTTPVNFLEQLSHHEPTDCLLFVDPRYFPATGRMLRDLIRQATTGTAATHVMIRPRTMRGAHEYVLVTAEGCVSSIKRYYDGVTHLWSTGIICSLVPVAAMHLAPELSLVPLASLRERLVAQGLANNDIVATYDVADLAQEHELLAVIEEFTRDAVAQSPPAPYETVAEGVYVGPGCSVHKSARLLGPVIVQADVTIEANTTIIGPAVLGPGARVRERAVIAQALVLPGATVPAGNVVRQRVYAENGSITSPGANTVRGNVPPSPVASNGYSVVEVARKNGTVTTSEATVVYDRIKLIAEAILALLGLVVLAPLFLVTAVLIKLETRGPTFFASRLEGKRGKAFRCWKFRTMVDGAHVQQRKLQHANYVDGPQFKIQNDPRVTKIGRWLRILNIDELPQLFNVLLGQMSLIGPRPSPFRENQICVPWRQARLSVRPGITGLWQICRHNRSAGDFHQWIYYDMLYVRHMSFWLDLKILIATLLTFGGQRSVPISWIIPSLKTEPLLSSSKARRQQDMPAVA